MAKKKGNALLVYIDDVAIGCLTNNTFTSSNEEIDATCKDNDGAYDSLAGGNTASITFSGMYEDSATYGFPEIVQAHKDKTEVAVRMGIAGSGGSYIQAARATISQLDWVGDVNTPVSYSGTINIRGTWSYGTHT